MIDMDNKVAIAVVVVAAVLVIGGAVAVIVAGMGSNQTKDYVVYDGNGGKTSEGNTTTNSRLTEAIANVFTNEGKVFTGWNTKADGSGTKIDIGENVTMGMTLYAQWSNYKLTIENTSGMFSGLGVYLTDDKHNMEKQTTFEFALSDSKAAVISFAFWDSVTVDPGTGIFTGKIGIWNTTLKFNITGATDVVYSVSDDGKVAMITIGYNGNVVFG